MQLVIFFCHKNFLFTFSKQVKLSSSFCLFAEPLPFPLSILIVPISDKKKSRLLCRGGRKKESKPDHIDSMDRHSCHLLCWNPLVWKADPISLFSGFNKQPSAVRESWSSLSPSIQLSSVSHGPQSQRKVSFHQFVRCLGLSGFEHLFGECFRLDICTNLNRSCQQTGYIKISHPFLIETQQNHFICGFQLHHQNSPDDFYPPEICLKMLVSCVCS